VYHCLNCHQQNCFKVIIIGEKCSIQQKVEMWWQNWKGEITLNNFQSLFMCAYLHVLRKYVKIENNAFKTGDCRRKFIHEWRSMSDTDNNDSDPYMLTMLCRWDKNHQNPEKNLPFSLQHLWLCIFFIGKISI